MAIAYHPKFEYVAVDVGGRCLHRRRRSAEGHRGKVRLDGSPGRRQLPRRSAGARRLPASVSRPRFARHPGRPRHARAGHRRRPHRARATARKTTSSAGSTASRPIVPVDAAGRFYHAEGAAGRLPEELIGKTVWEANPIVIEILQAARRAAGARKDRAQLSALLALPQPHHLPRHRAVVHRHGAQRLPPARARSHQQGEVDARVGRGAHLQHDRHAARLVHLAPARLGRAHHRVLLRGCREPLTDRKILDRVVELFAEHTADIWYRAHRRRTAAGRDDVREVRRRGVHARRTTFWTSGSIPARATWPC